MLQQKLALALFLSTNDWCYRELRWCGESNWRDRGTKSTDGKLLVLLMVQAPLAPSVQQTGTAPRRSGILLGEQRAVLQEHNCYSLAVILVFWAGSHTNDACIQWLQTRYATGAVSRICP